MAAKKRSVVATRADPRPATAPRGLPAREALLARLRDAFPGASDASLLGPPLTAKALASLEKKLGVKVPEPLRAFWLTVGHGGRGPSGTLDASTTCTARLAASADAGRPLPFGARNLDRAIAEKRTDASHVLYDPDAEAPPLHGVLPIGEAGGGLLYAVPTQGKHAGRVWLVGEAWSPELGADDRPVDFVTWYLAWLERVAPAAAKVPPAAKAAPAAKPPRATAGASTTTNPSVDPTWPQALRAALKAPAKAKRLGLADYYDDHVPDVFDRLPELEQLSISHNRAKALPASMASLRKLRKLWLTSMDALADVEAITSLDGLTFLNLGRSRSVRLAESVAGWRSLETLYLSFTRLKDLPEALATLPRLAQLHLDLCFSLDMRQAWPVIARMPALRQLNLAQSRLLRWPARLERPPVLERLSLGRAELPEGQLEALRRALPGVTIDA